MANGRGLGDNLAKAREVWKANIEAKKVTPATRGRKKSAK